MMVERNRQSVTFTLSEEGHERLEQLSKEFFLSRSQVVDGLIRFYDIVQAQARQYEVVTRPDGEKEVWWRDSEDDNLYEMDPQGELIEFARRIGQGVLVRAWNEEVQG